MDISTFRAMLYSKSDDLRARNKMHLSRLICQDPPHTATYPAFSAIFLSSFLSHWF